MPVAGEEGYEKLVICPYDRAHEIRQGRMQIHLDKCRKNFPDKEIIRCPFNSTHLIPKVEEQFHTEEECRSRTTWDRYTHEVGDTNCPVKNLVPVNAATVPHGDENWDDFEAQGSVLNTIKAEASEKKIFRMMQCESKAKRKTFREQEKLRHSAMEDKMNFQEVSTISLGNEPLRRPTKTSLINIKRQDPKDAVAQISKQFRTLDMNMKPASSNYAASNSSSMRNGPPSTIEPSSLAPLESAASPCSRPSPSYAIASTPRPSTAMSSALSTISRPSTATSIAESASKMHQAKNQFDDVFCQIPIPGLGRGARRKVKPQEL